MAKTNLTLQLDEDVIRRPRIVAAKRGTSVSALVARAGTANLLTRPRAGNISSDARAGFAGRTAS
jgi:hypothetical protein